MKELTIEEKAKAYDEAIKRGLDYIRHTPATEIVTRQDIFEAIFPEFKKSEDKKVIETLIELVKCNERSGYTLLNNVPTSSMLAWLEKQAKKEEDVRYKYLEEILAADDKYQMSVNEVMLANAKEQAVNALSKLQVSKLLNLAEKPYTFKSIPRLLEMVIPCDRAKCYCQKLIDILKEEGYVDDAKIITNYLKEMNGENVAMAVQDNNRQAWSDKNKTIVFNQDKPL